MIVRAKAAQVRHGLTLIELVVVMLILVALAGILIPILPAMIGRAHTSTSATNTGELSKAIHLHEVTHYQYPDQYDSLLGTGGTAIFTKLPGGATGDLTTLDLAATALTTEWLAALNEAGIANVWDLDDATTDPTFGPYGAVRTLAATGNIVTLTNSAKTKLGLPVAHTYMVVGVGRKCTMVGRTLTDPPVHFADSATEAPDRAYARVGAIFALTKTVGVTEVDVERARFVGTVSFHGDGVSGTDDHLREYYGIANDGGN